MADKEYIRLARPGSRSGFQVVTTSRSSLWLGKDHLLCIETNGYTENYKRFYFRDIQGVTIWKTNQYLIMNAVLGTLVALFAVIGLSILGESQTGAIILWCIGALFAIPLVVNLFRGPTCTVRLRTAVQEDELPALKRVKQVQKVMARIRPLIAEAQGELTRAEITERFSQMPPVLGAQPAAMSSTPAPSAFAS